MKAIATLKIGVSGIRGVVGDTLKPSLLCRFARSFATYLGGGSIVVGRDTRVSGEMVEHAVLAGLLETGMRVIDVGICPTPTIQHAVKTLRCQGGIAITASHNPAEWNALKLIKANGRFLNRYEAEELLGLYHQEAVAPSQQPQLHQLESYPRAIEDHQEHILSQLSPRGVPPLRVAIDCCGGAGALAGPQMLRRLGCEPLELYCQPTGHFPRPPEPLPQNLGQLCELVRSEGAAIGFAQDADADRLALVDEQGRPIGEEYTLALCCSAVLRRERGAMVTTISASGMHDEVAASFDCPIYRTAIGEVNVTEMMEATDAVIGGEGNGGVIYPKANFTRDSFVAMTLIVDLLRESGRTVSELVSDFPAWVLKKKVLELDPHRIYHLIEKLKEVYGNERLNLVDGVRVDRDQGWLHVRPSNTEPILRIMVEACDEETASAYLEELQTKISQLCDTL